MPFAFNADPNAGEQNAIERQKLYLLKRQQDADLVTKGFNPDTLQPITNSDADVQRQQNRILNQNMQALQGKLAAQDSDKALVNFATTGDASHLQNALDQNPQLKQAWASKGVHNVSSINFSDPQDQKMLSQQGIQSSAYNTTEKQDILNKNLFKTYDGTKWNVNMLSNAVQQTGAINRVSPQDANTLIDNHQQLRDMMAGPKNSFNTAEGSPYKDQINAASQATGVPPNLIAAMLNKESNGNPSAVSPKGASVGTGLMQVGQQAAQDVGMSDANLNDPAQNIMAGAKYMAKQLDKYKGNTQLALAAYNAGPGAVDTHNGIPPYPETQQYVGKIMKNYAAGESYNDVGNSAVKDASSYASQPTVQHNPDGTVDTSQYDNRIATIQKFAEGNAMAAAGTDPNLALLKLRYGAMTDTEKNMMGARDQTSQLVQNFGGEDKFMNSTNFDQGTADGQKNFNKAWPQVVAISKLEGTNLSDADKSTVQDVRNLIGLSGKAVNLESSNTGLIGDAFSNWRKYMSDNVDGVEAKAAYTAFNSYFMHAMDGSRITPLEQEQQDRAFGTLKEKAGPALAQFKNALETVQNKLNSVVTLSNPYTAKVLLGADQAHVQGILNSLTDRINYLQGLSNKPGETKVSPVTEMNNANKDKRPSLDSIFGGK